METKKSKTYRFSPELIERIQLLADHEDLNETVIVTALIEAGLDCLEKEATLSHSSLLTRIRGDFAAVEQRYTAINEKIAFLEQRIASLSAEIEELKKRKR
ncbi:MULTISPECIES: DUF465 domain-containing protein [unclassified Coleofasciculus]|uniref:DUF465 domain-containing protein n=1 Tax=unclassified Coleofasciculus TaxID=2692782 RepID=UPI0018826963|nr:MULTISPECIES: DUF465 domain-containing protein [unclassified Coleofasciculus]MBE9124739.1 DUF465 domain-containing protein [Coleofasciculus sp. LEGE 07081]MBE9148191.1 DUF465 domain-containing protein [Coleofasciculus sp. LEGE 07092]